MELGPTSERDYGLLKPNGTPAYSLGLTANDLVTNTTTIVGGYTSNSGGSNESSTKAPLFRVRHILGERGCFCRHGQYRWR